MRLHRTFYRAEGDTMKSQYPSEEQIDCIRQALPALQKKRPAYKALLAFYGPLFEAQETLAAKIPTDEAMLDQRSVNTRKKEGFPLLSPVDFPLDSSALQDLLGQLCSLAQDAGGDMGAAAAAIEAGLQNRKLTAVVLGTAVVEPSGIRLARYADQIGVDRTLLSTIGYHTIRPSLIAWSRRLGEKPGVCSPWEEGVCPICGSVPAISILEENGGRQLVCGFCWHRWPHRRAACPFCRATGGETVRYFFDEPEPESRVDLCEACRQYLKCVDTRRLDRAVYPPLEALTTLHLDMKAQDMGYVAAGEPNI